MNIDYTPFIALIKTRSGLIVDDGPALDLKGAIREIMQRKGINSWEKYFSLICSDPKEFVNLVGYLTIKETYFFREPDQIKVLTERIMPDLLSRKKKGEKIRILSAGCSYGAEPYSIVIALLEEYGQAANHFISVTGIDIDNNAIEAAKRGVYGRSFFRALDPDLKKKYFDDLGKQGHSIKTVVKESVSFLNVNLINDNYPEFINVSDIIFYRNVSIYFEAEQRKKVFSKLKNLLSSDGYLIMSSTETMHHIADDLSFVEMDGIFLYQKNIDGPGNKVGKIRLDLKQEADWCMLQDTAFTRKIELSPGTGLVEKVFSFSDALAKIQSKPSRQGITTADAESMKDIDNRYRDALACANEKEYDRAISIIEAIIESTPAFLQAYVLKAQVLLNLQEVTKAKEVCLKMIEVDRLCLAGYLLLGLIAGLENDLPEAARRFKEAIYIDPSIWLPHFHLAQIYQADGNLKQACREYESVIRITEQGGFQNYGLVLSFAMITPQQVKYFCEKNIKELIGA